MRLFHQLNEDEQNDVIGYCVNMVLDDLLEDGVQIDPVTPEDIALKEHIEEMLVNAKKFVTEDEQIKYLMDDKKISDAVFDIAIEMAKSAYMHDSDELIIYPDELKENNEDEGHEECPDCAAETKAKKSHSIN